MKRCFPFDSPPSTRVPTIISPRAAALTFGAVISNPVTRCPASTRRSTTAVRKIVSPSGTAQQVPARRSPEPGRAEGLGQGRLVDRRTVDLLDEERIAPLGHGLGREGAGNGGPAAGEFALLPFDEGEHAVLVPRDVRGERAVHEDHERSGHAHRLAAPIALGPAEGCAIWSGG